MILILSIRKIDETYLKFEEYEENIFSINIGN